MHATCHPCLEELTCGPCGSRCSHQARDERGTPCWAMVLLQWFIPYRIPWIPFIQFQQTWQWTDIWNIHEHTSLGLPLWISLIPDVFGGWRRTFGRTYSKRNICWKKWIEGLTSICYTVGWVYQVLLRAKQTMCDGQTPSCFHRKETITFGLWGKTLGDALTLTTKPSIVMRRNAHGAPR